MNPKPNAKTLSAAFFRGFAGLAACLACCLALPAAPALAADATWNTQAGNWNASGNWLGGSPGTTSGTTSTDTAWFSANLTGTTRTVTVDSNRNIRNITFDAGNSGTWGYNLSGGSLLLTSGGTISSTGGVGAHTDTISAPMTILGNNATYTISNDSTLATRLLSITGAITGQSTTGGTTTLTLGGNNPGVNLIGNISNGTNGGVIGITKEGSTTWQISRPSDSFRTFSGPLRINAGTFRLEAGGDTTRYLQSLGAGVAVTLADVAGATLDLNGNTLAPIGSLAGGGSTGGGVSLGSATLTTGLDNTNTSFGGTIQGTGGLTKVGTGIQTLSGTNGYTGATQVSGGGGIALDFSAASTASNIISASSGLGLGGGTFRVTGKGNAVNSQTMASTTVGSGANAVLLNANSATSLLLDLKAITRSAGGTLDVSLPTGTQSSTNGVITTTTSLTNSVLVSAASSGIAYATVGGTDWAGLSSGNIVAMTTYQTGNANYTTNNNVNVANGDSVSGVTVNTLRFNGNNTLNLSGVNTVSTGGILVTNAATTGATISSGTLRSGGGREMVLINNGAQLTVGSVIADSSSGASALTISGTGTTILNGLNTYTGATTINNGTVKAGSSQALGLSGSSAVTIADNPNAVLDLNGNDLSIASLNGTRTAVLGGGSTVGTSGGTLALGASSLTLGSGNFAGTITGAGGRLIKTGAGTLTLSGSSSFTGGVTIRAGTVNIPQLNDNWTPLGTGAVTLGDAAGGSSNASLTYDGFMPSSVLASGSYTNNIVLAPNTTGTLTLQGAASNRRVVLAGNVTGTNNLTINSNSGVSTFNHAINNTGNLTVNWTSVNNTGGLNGSVGSSVVNVSLNQNNSSNAVIFAASFNNTGMITAAGSGASNLTLNGVIGNTTGVTQNSTTSRLILGAANTYTGDTLVQSGTLQLNNNLSIQNSAFDTAGAGVLVLNGVTTPTFGGLKGSTSLSTTNITGYGSITALTLNPQSGKSYSYSGNIANGVANMTLTKSGSGTQVLSGSNSYSGATTVSLGVLRLDSANALPGGIGATGGVANLTINGGVIGLGNGDFNRGAGTGATQVQITGGGGFAAYNADRIVNLGGASGTATWGSGNFITTAGGTFVLGAADADRMVTFQNPIDLGASARTVQVDNGSASVDATLSGVLSSVSAGNGLTKTGAGTLDLTAANSFNGTLAVQDGTVRFTSLAAAGSAQNLGAGTLVNLGVASTSSGELDYRGSGGTLDKNITALGNGRNRIRNSGAGTLTLSGTLTKNGTILELAGGTFTVSGRITGANANSDLFVNGAAVTLSSTNNDYNGPTYVYNNGSITLGASNVIPNNSALLLGGTGSDTGIGTIDTGTFTDTIASLTSSSLGSTIGITINGATAGGLTTTGNVTFGAGTDTLNLSLTSLSAGRYQLLTYQGTRSGTFDAVNITNPDSRYNLVYGGASGSSIDLQMKANQASTFTLAPAASRVLVGGSTQLSGLLANSSPTGAAALAWSPVSTGSLSAVNSSLGSTIAAGSTSSITAWLSAGNTAGTQNWSITNTDNNAITTVSTATGSIDVVNQRSFSVSNSGTINLGNFLRTGSVTGSTTISSTGLNATTANATLGSFSGTNTNGLSLGLATGTNFFNGGLALQEAVYSLSGSAASAGAINGTFSSNVSAELGTIDPVTVSLVGTAYDPAIASFTTPSTTTSWSVDIGEFNQNTGDHTKGFSIFNLFNDPTYTADLRLLSITDIGTPSGSLSIDLTPALFGDLLAGGTSNWLASLSSLTTGSFSNQYQLNFVSAKNGQSLGGPQSMTLTVTGVIVVPEPGALALAGIGIAAAAYAYRRRRS